MAPRLLFSLLLVTLLAACGIPQSGTRPATAPEEPLDLSLVPPPETPAQAPRRPRSADVVHKTAAEARALFGAPASLRREPPGEVWQYLSDTPHCTLLLFLYPSETDPRLRVTHAQVLGRTRGQTVDDSDCVAALLKTEPPPRKTPGPIS
ncbi:hypothetical protein [Ferrovibrio xuzhouensis]|uniref:Outer membrane protein assembly factor BamE n=1 Tax=Ferrovibrio xuzhouensis TaxID=1576914 RepID=A0ABV7VCL6_9PROT